MYCQTFIQYDTTFKDHISGWLTSIIMTSHFSLHSCQRLFQERRHDILQIISVPVLNNLFFGWNSVYFWLVYDNMSLLSFWEWKETHKLLHLHTAYILNTVLLSIFSSVKCLFHNLCIHVAWRAATLCQSLLRSKYYFIPSCLMRSQVCRASSDKDEERTWHTPYKASPVRSWLNSGIIRIAGLWRDSPFPFYCNWKAAFSDDLFFISQVDTLRCDDVLIVCAKYFNCTKKCIKSQVYRISLLRKSYFTPVTRFSSKCVSM